MAVDFDKIKNTVLSDPRYLTTPLGALTGLLAVRALAPPERRSPGMYALGAAGGGAAGFGLGAYLKERWAQPGMQQRRQMAYTFMKRPDKAQLYAQALKDPAQLEKLQRAAGSAMHAFFQTDEKGNPRSANFFSDTPLGKEELEVAPVTYGIPQAHGVGPWITAGAAGVGAVGGPALRAKYPSAEYKRIVEPGQTAFATAQEKYMLAKLVAKDPVALAAAEAIKPDPAMLSGGGKLPFLKQMVGAKGRNIWGPAAALAATTGLLGGGVEHFTEGAQHNAVEYLGWKARHDYIVDLLRGKNALLEPAEAAQWQQALEKVDWNMNKARIKRGLWRTVKWGE